jgi:hypothetical protein
MLRPSLILAVTPSTEYQLHRLLRHRCQTVRWKRRRVCFQRLPRGTRLQMAARCRLPVVQAVILKANSQQRPGESGRHGRYEPGSQLVPPVAPEVLPRAMELTCSTVRDAGFFLGTGFLACTRAQSGTPVRSTDVCIISYQGSDSSGASRLLVVETLSVYTLLTLPFPSCPTHDIGAASEASSPLASLKIQPSSRSSDPP